ncbi:hypothetical protein TVAGG3_0297660 [Trichomonas vaginalis G3]|uniref:hypothetical protein n=1 Tax=Trichomonas vaginalis (strain ATCC PRA-98 / G3) TaxID=412133 RepID=UPI0021E60BEA|nr:hypothetical protein TVAGG3_0297660 [Trichomonas vaginalis G3]KAI5527714.1 hypothetical protein TVAGG3_0297660 [Trichomonas vaginalis G3]
MRPTPIIKSNLGTGNVTYSSQSPTQLSRVFNTHEGNEVIQAITTQPKSYLETGLNITKTYYLFATKRSFQRLCH